MTGTDLCVNKPHCTAAAQCGLFTYKSVPVIFEPPYMLLIWDWFSKFTGLWTFPVSARMREQARNVELSLCENIVHEGKGSRNEEVGLLLVETSTCG